MTYDDSPGRSVTILPRGTASSLIAASAYTVIAAGALWMVEGIPTAARVSLALPILLFTPGFAVVTALFPLSGTTTPMSGLERSVLAVVASVAVVPIVAFATTVVAGFDLGLVLAGVTGVTVVASVVGIVRGWGGELGSRRSDSDRGNGSSTLTDGVTLLAIAVIALLLVASAAVAYSGDDGGDLMTEFYLMDGPDSAPDDGQAAYELRIDHHVDHTQEYTVVVMVDGDGSSASEVDRISTEVGPDDTGEITATVSGSELEADATVRFLLYTDAAPSTPAAESAHRVLQVSVDAADE